MDHGIRAGWWLLGTALFLGSLGDVLLRTDRWGLNVALWATALAVGVVLWLRRERRAPLPRPVPGALLSSVGFAAGLAWRDSPVLGALDVSALLLCLALAARSAWGAPVTRGGVWDYAGGALRAATDACVGALALLLRELPWQDVPRSGRWRHAPAALRGLALVCPLLLLFGSLFMAADAVFAHLINSLFRWDWSDVTSHLLGTGFWTWVVAGFLRGLRRERGTTDEENPPGPAAMRPAPSLGPVEVGVILGLLDLLFLTFVLVQIRYFFGGAAHVQETTGLTYAQYARRGFFELVTVSALVLPLLLGLHALLPADDARGRRLFRLLAGGQISLLFIIMASALGRMRLYQAEYGLTELRFYTTAFMGWLAVVFVWFVVTVLRGQRERFVFGALVTGFAVIAVLHGLNPDATIVRANVARAMAGRRFDAAYAASLSADAVPALVAALPHLPPSDAAALTARMQRRWPAVMSPDWRSWNWSRAQARRLAGAAGPGVVTGQHPAREASR